MHYPAQPLIATNLADQYAAERRGAAVRFARPSALSALVSRVSARRTPPPVISPTARVTARAGR